VSVPDSLGLAYWNGATVLLIAAFTIFSISLNRCCHLLARWLKPFPEVFVRSRIENTTQIRELQMSSFRTSQPSTVRYFY
jgi:hypothetical protein